MLRENVKQGNAARRDKKSVPVSIACIKWRDTVSGSSRAAVGVTGRFIDTLNRVFAGKAQIACRYLQKFIPLMVCTLAVLEAAL